MSGTADQVRVEVWPMRTGPLYFPVVEGRDAEAVLSALPPGCAAYITDAEVRDGLLGRDAKQVRELHTMRHELSDIPAVAEVPGVTFRPWQHDDARALAAALLGAYGPGHPDAREPDQDKAADFLASTAEDPDNPVMAGTQVAVHEDRPVGTALVLRCEHVSAWQGPWLMNTFRAPAPELKGLGAAMLARTLRAVREAGGPHVGLAVTSSNPARRLYQRLGFVDDSQGWVLVMPEASDR